MKKYEITNKGKIIIGIALLLLLVVVGIIIYFVIPKGKAITRIYIEMGYPNEGIIVDNPVLGMSTELKVGKKIKLLNTIYPAKHKKTSTKYVVENPEIAYVNDEDMLVGKSSGTTKLYMTTTEGKTIKSNIIEITIID